jgi:cyanophycin synthetase
LKKNGIRIFVDFAHNEHGLNAVSETIRAFHAKRHIVLMGQAGDRTDKDIGDFVRAACKMSPDELLVCQLPGYERGRELAAVPKLICEFARQENVPEDAITLVASPIDGVRKALSDARGGDCLVLLALTQRDEVLEMIKSFIVEN